MAGRLSSLWNVIRRPAIVLLVLTPILFTAWQAHKFSGEACPTPQSSAVRAERDVRPDKRLPSLSPAPNSDSLIVLIPNEHALIRALSFDLSKESTTALRNVVVEVAGDLVRSDQGAIFPKNDIVPWTEVSADGRSLTVWVCFASFNPARVDSGTYQGQLEIRSPGIHTQEVPMTASVRWPNGWLVWLVAYVAVLAGLASKALSDIAKRRRSSARRQVKGRVTTKPPDLGKELNAYFREPLTIVSLIVAVGFVCYAVFTLYFSNPIFGAQGDWLKLGIFCYVTVVGGLAATELAAVLNPRVDGDDSNGEPA